MTAAGRDEFLKAMQLFTALWEFNADDFFTRYSGNLRFSTHADTTVFDLQYERNNLHRRTESFRVQPTRQGIRRTLSAIHARMLTNETILSLTRAQHYEFVAAAGADPDLKLPKTSDIMVITTSRTFLPHDKRRNPDYIADGSEYDDHHFIGYESDQEALLHRLKLPF